jgi:hypothetical protein
VPLKVWLDGAPVAEGAPARIEGVPRGLHTVEVRARGFHPYTQEVRIGPDGEHTMRVRLRPEGGAP